MRFGDRLSSAVLCCLLVALAFVGPLSDALAEHSDGWPDIVLAKSLAGTYQLYGVMADGSELDQLYPWGDSVDRRYPVYAPNRRVVAYARGYEGTPDGQNGVYTLDLTTGEERFLFADPFAYPSQWSPDGSRLLITHEEPAYTWAEVWVVDADGSDPVLLAGDFALEDWARDPRWLADGSKVVFVWNPAPHLLSDRHIWAVNPDGTGLTKLTTGTGPYSAPRPSPDGGLIAYVYGDVYGGNIYTMETDGSGGVQLTGTGMDLLHRNPWSPDGTTILFTIDEGPPDDFQIYRMNRDGTNQTNLSPAWSSHYLPCDWSPDGGQIAFKDAGSHLGVMNADGSSATIIVSDVSFISLHATWRASGIRRVYLPFLDVTPDTSITVPVNVDTCLGVAGMQIELTYDPDIVECTGVVKGPLLPGSWAMPSPNIDNVTGNVKFLAYDAGAAPLPAGSGEMFTMSFHVKATASCCTTAPLHFAKCLISDEWGDPILMTPVDGAVTTPTPECSLTIEGTNGSVEVDGTPHALPWTGSVPCGTEVSLLAVPDSGYEFSGWSGDLTTTDNPAYLVVDESKTVTAGFSSTMCSLTILGTNGSVLVIGTPHALPWSGNYTCGTELLIEAVADPGYTFGGWSGDVGDLEQCCNWLWIMIDGDLTVTANFQLTCTLSLDKTGSGYIATDGEPRALPWSGPYAYGMSVELEAVPHDEHWVFDQWSGDLTGSTNPTSLLMDGPKSVTAHFLQHLLSLSCSANPNVVYSGGTTNLAAIAADSIGHSVSMYWEDMLEFDPYVVTSLGGGSPTDVVVEGDYAYVAAGGVLTVYDISSSADPQIVGLCDIAEMTCQIALVGSYVYVTGRYEGLHIVNVVDPTHPVEIDHSLVLDDVQAVSAAGRYVYVSNFGSYLDEVQVVDALDPGAPVLAGSCQVENRVFGIAVDGNRLYAAYYGGTILIDVSTPAAPAVVSTCSDAPGRAIAGEGMYAYTARDDLYVVDFSDAENPVASLVDTSVGFANGRIVLDGNRLYVPDAYDGLRIYDITTPSAPALVGVSAAPEGGLSVAPVADLAYVASAGGLYILDVADAAAMSVVGSDRTWGGVTDVCIVGRYAYVALAEAGLRIIDLEASGGPVEVGSYRIPDGCMRSVDVAWPYLYGGTMSSDSSTGVVVLDISNAGNPTFVGSWVSPDIMGCPPGVKAAGGYVYASTRCESDIRVIDVTDPANPTQVATCATSSPLSCYSEVSVFGSVGYVPSQNGVDVLDLSDPTLPVNLGSVPGAPAGWVFTAGIVDGSLIVSGENDLRTFDISDPAAPALLMTQSYPSFDVWGITGAGSRAYLAVMSGGNAGMRVMDMADPAAPSLIGSYDGLGSGWWLGPVVAASGDALYFGDAGWGLHLFDISSPPTGLLGSFSPSPYVANPTYTAPENTSDQDLPVRIQVTATCDGDPSLVEAASCTLTVKPCAAMTVISSEGTRGEVARIPVVLDLLASVADRLSFTVAVTPVAGAPAVTESLGFEAAAGLPAPGLVIPSGNQVSVAWLSPLAEPISGGVPLGDLLVPVPAGADLGDLYSICLTVVGASLGADEICVEAGECATVFACVEILSGDCYRYDPPMADGNSDGDTCDWGEYNDDSLGWGDVITTFDAWTIPGIFTCGVGSHRYNAMDSYPRDGEPGIGGDGAIGWGDVITTFDRWTGMQEIAWRPICWVGELEPTSEPRVAASSGRAAVVSEAPSLQLGDVSGEAGGTVRMPVVLELHGYQADRFGFSVEVVPQVATGDAPVVSGFEAAEGLSNPVTVARSDGGLAVAWMMPIQTALTGSVALGELVFELPAEVTEEISWQVRISAAGASLGESELEAAVSLNDSATVTVSPAAPHDVGIARFQAPGSAREGSTKTLTIVVENLTETAENVVVRLRRGGEVVSEWTLDLAGKERQRLRTDYRFVSEDIPRVEFTTEVVATADDRPENNTATCEVRVR